MPKIKPVKALELIKFLNKQGFEIVRRKSSHVTLKKDNTAITIPIHRKPLGIGIIKRVLNDIGIPGSELIKEIKKSRNK